MSMPITMQLTAAHARVAKLEEQLATVTAERDALQAELAAARAKELSEEDVAGLEFARKYISERRLVFFDGSPYDRALSALDKLLGRKDQP